MTISLVQYMITFLKMFPSKNGISSDLRPSAIILGYPNPYYNNIKIKFGSYAQVYLGITNSTKQRKVGDITLMPEKNGADIILCD